MNDRQIFFDSSACSIKTRLNRLYKSLSEFFSPPNDHQNWCFVSVSVGFSALT